MRSTSPSGSLKPKESGRGSRPRAKGREAKGEGALIEGAKTPAGPRTILVRKVSPGGGRRVPWCDKIIDRRCHVPSAARATRLWIDVGVHVSPYISRVL